MRMVVKIEVEASGGGDATLRVVGPDGVTGEGTFGVPCGTEERWATIVTTALPDVVKAYTPASLSWSVRPPGEAEYRSVGATPHRIYVTLDTPTGSEPTNRRMNLICYATANLADQQAVATAIWEVLDNEPPVFDLQQGSCPAPCPWSLMVPGNPGQCIDLAVLMEHACKIIGVPASIGFAYATTDMQNFSTSDTAHETRQYEYAPGQSRHEYLRYFASGGINNWEAVCVVDTHYYAVKETHDGDTVALIKDIICPNQLGENYQCWTYLVHVPPDDPYWTCNTQDQYPAPLPGGCP